MTFLGIYLGVVLVWNVAKGCLTEMALGIMAYDQSAKVMFRGEFWSGAAWDGAAWVGHLAGATLCYLYHRAAKARNRVAVH